LWQQNALRLREKAASIEHATCERRGEVIIAAPKLFEPIRKGNVASTAERQAVVDAFGAKRTLTRQANRLSRSKMTQLVSLSRSFGAVQRADHRWRLGLNWPDKLG
jgi:hypothetical protein